MLAIILDSFAPSSIALEDAHDVEAVLAELDKRHSETGPAPAPVRHSARASKPYEGNATWVAVSWLYPWPPHAAPRGPRRRHNSVSPRRPLAKKHSEGLYDPFAMAHPTVAPICTPSNQSKGLVMSDILRMAMVLVMLAIAATGVAQARPINYEHHHFRAGHAGPMHSQAPRAFNNPGFGCLAHPDYGLYTPHFC
jgi:hypothetical protein